MRRPHHPLAVVPRALLALLLLLLPGVGAALAADTPWGPVPEELAILSGTAADEDLATRALADLEQAVLARETTAILDARALLVLLSDVGLRYAAVALADDQTPASMRPHLLHVVASAEHPAADLLLARTARSARSDLRTMAAEGLGRGRSDAAVDALVLLAADAAPAVRAVALRSLFALESDAAVDARHGLPVDPRSDLHARRLRWHRVRGRATPALYPLTLEAYRRGRSPAEREAAMRLLVLPALQPPLAVLQAIVRETGTDALGAVAARLALGVERTGYDPLQQRTIAILAAFHAQAHADASSALRTAMIDRLVGWLAQPVRGDPYDDRPIPENLLRMVLPDLGAAVLEPTLRRLRRGGFRDARDGVDVLLETLSRDEAVAHLCTLVAPDATPPVPTSVRIAAAGALRTLGTLGDEALARRLVRPEEQLAIRRDTVRALVGDDTTWAVPLLTSLATGKDPVTSPDAVTTLEERKDPPSRQALVELLFGGARNPEARLLHLVAPGDDLAFQVLERALTQKRGALRNAALHAMHRVRALHGERSVTLLRAYEELPQGPRARTHELQQLLYAWLAQAPVEGLAWVRDTWPTFRALNWEATAVKSLQNARHPDIDALVVDHVLDVAKGGEPTVDPEILQVAATALDGRRGHRDEDLDGFWRRLLSSTNQDVVWSAIYSLDHPGRADLSDLLLPLLADLDLAEQDAAARASAIIEVLEHQPWPAVEPVLVDLLLDTRADPSIRRQAGVLLVDHVSADSRQRLLTWITGADAATDDIGVLRVLGRVVGTGGGAEVATAVTPLLIRLLFETYGEARTLDPDADNEHEAAGRIEALAQALGPTRHAPSLEAVVAALFDERFARYARRGVARQGRRLGPADASGTARAGPGLLAAWHRRDDAYDPMPWEVFAVTTGLKRAGDSLLADVFAVVLGRLRANGALARFPDLYLDRVAVALRDRPTGDLARAAAAVTLWMDRLEPVDGASDYGVHADAAELAEIEGRYADAARFSATAVRILSRRAYDDEEMWNWRRARSGVDAWRGAALCHAGRTDDANTAFGRAVSRTPYDATTLATVARARGRCGADLDTALALAERAATLEIRVFDEANLTTADTLALLHLERGEPAKAARTILSVLPRTRSLRGTGGRYHHRLAQALVTLGRLDAAADAVRKALGAEPTLATRMREDPYLAPLVTSGRLDDLVAEAELTAVSHLGDE